MTNDEGLAPHPSSGQLQGNPNLVSLEGPAADFLKTLSQLSVFICPVMLAFSPLSFAGLILRTLSHKLLFVCASQETQRVTFLNY